MIGGLSPWHILIVVIALAVLFGGRGKLSSIMGDAAKGVRAFKDGLKGEEVEGASTAPAAPAAVAHDALAEAKAREQSLREELARQTAAREAAEARARESAV